MTTPWIGLTLYILAVTFWILVTTCRCLLQSLQNFTQLWGYPKNRRWWRCCLTGVCSMTQSHSTHSNSCGNALIIISLAAVLWCHTAGFRRRTAALGCHTSALKQLQHTLRCCRGSEAVCLIALLCHTKAMWLLHSCALYRRALDRKEGHRVQTQNTE